ncbi:MAG: DNA-processing protein DprA [Candidatus Omnitrophota bacterium]
MKRACYDIIALNLVPGLGCRGIHALLNAAPDTGDIFGMSDIRLSGILGRKFEGADRIRSVRCSPEYAGEIEFIEKNGIKTVSWRDEDYPADLRNIYDPPVLLCYKGTLLPGDTDAVAVVGSRRCSLYGLQMSEKFSFELAVRGITVISGMARGIDSAAHRGALKAGGRTIAVMGSGFAHVYPREAEKFLQDIIENGAVITEYPSWAEPARENFPRRNRIISGMSKGVLVVEAAKKSGAMITVNLALEQGKEVFAVPGRIDMSTSDGTNMLIQSGAKLAWGVDDLLEELDLGPREARTGRKDIPGSPEKRAPDENHLRVLKALGSGDPVHMDNIGECSGIDAAALQETLLRMEIRGAIRALPGRSYVRV